jgi:hypothetical protein
VAGSKKVSVIVTSAAAAAGLVYGGVKLAGSVGDDVARSVGDDVVRSVGDDIARSAGDDIARTGDDLTRSAGDDLTRSAGDDVARSAGDDSARTGNDIAREAAKGAACDVLYIAATEGRLPNDTEWDNIAQEALIDFVTSDESSASQLVDQTMREVSEAITDDGFVDGEEAESLADELVCS